MLSQLKVNEACQILKRSGQNITISRVYRLLNRQHSFFDLINKVLLYKKDAEKAKKIAKEESNLTSTSSSKKLPLNLGMLIDRSLLPYTLVKHERIVFNLKEKLQEYIKDSIEERLDRYKEEVEILRKKNDYLEVVYYSSRTRFRKLIQDKKILTEQNLKLRQRLTLKERERGYKLGEYNEKHQHKSIDTVMKSYHKQIDLLKSTCCAAYDIEKKNIVVKVIPNHKLENEFQKGIRSIHLHATAIYDFKTKFWFLGQFEAKTINLLLKNDFSISPELAYIFQKLQEVI